MSEKVVLRAAPPRGPVNCQTFGSEAEGGHVDGEGVDDDLGKWDRPWPVSFVLDGPELWSAVGPALHELAVDEEVSTQPVHPVVRHGESF